MGCNQCNGGCGNQYPRPIKPQYPQGGCGSGGNGSGGNGSGVNDYYGEIPGQNYYMTDSQQYNNYYNRYNHYYITRYNYVTDYVTDYNVYHLNQQTVYNGMHSLGSYDMWDNGNGNGCGIGQGQGQGCGQNTGCGCVKPMPRPCGCK